MKAIQFSEYGAPEVLQFVDVPSPEVKPGQVLVEVKATGVNFADVMRRYGTYLQKTPLPYVLGAEVAGIVTEVSPEVRNVRVGDRVVALTENGGYAQSIALYEQQLVPIPEAVSFEQAAAILLQGLTAFHCLKTSGRLTQGETVLVHAAAGGVGTLAVQLAKIFGAEKVIATASTPSKLDLATSLGADHGINYTEDNWKEQVLDLTGGKGVDVILEMVGGDIFHKSLECLATNGRLVIYGRAGKEPTMFDPRVLMYRNTSVVGFWLSRIIQQPKVYAESIQELLGYVAAGRCRLILGEVLPLAEAAKAHQLLEGRKTTGKVVLVP